MPPKQGFTPRKWFLDYSEEALPAAEEVDLGTRRITGNAARERAIRTAARNKAERIWQNVGRGAARRNRNKFEKACTKVKRLEDDIETRERIMAQWHQRWFELNHVNNRDQEDVQHMLEAWEGWYNCQIELIDVRENLVAQSKIMTLHLSRIYRTILMREHAQQRHQGIVDAEAQAYTQLQEIKDAVEDLGIPETLGNEIKIPEQWLPGFKLREKLIRTKRAFLADDVAPWRGNAQGWYGCWPMPHQGGHSRTGIWAKIDDNDRITDRVVRKDTQDSARCWSDVTRWEYPSDGMRDNEDEIVPMEVVCNRDLAAISSIRFNEAVNVVRLRHHNLDIDKLTHSIYLHYCSRGDLDSLIKRYTSEPTYGQPRPTSYIPEPFLWRIFLALAVAGLAMETGTVALNGENRDWTKEIVHRDLKPGNVFLDEPSGHFVSYPTVRLGDFGIATKTHYKDLLNPSILLHWEGTRPWAAPEQFVYSDLRTGEPVHRFKQLSYTNVYGIGMTMLSLVTLVRVPEIQLAWGQYTCGHNLMAPPYNENASRYSHNLIGLVQECIQFDPSDRITFEEILNRIEEAISSFDLDKGRKDAPADSQTLAHHDDLLCPTDAYAAALTRVDMPAPADM